MPLTIGTEAAPYFSKAASTAGENTESVLASDSRSALMFLTRSKMNGREGQICKFLQLPKKKSDPKTATSCKKKTANNCNFLMFFDRGQICKICKKLQLADFAPRGEKSASMKCAVEA